MELLKALGVDSTWWIHLACFMTAYLALSQLVFGPYMRAFQERERRTVGNQEDAVRLIGEAEQLTGEFDQKAKAINGEIKRIYDQRRAEALQEYDRAVQSARDEAGAILAKARERIATELQNARRQLLTEAPGIASAISTKLAGKELN